jgi:hypothetical protein
MPPRMAKIIYYNVSTAKYERMLALYLVEKDKPTSGWLMLWLFKVIDMGTLWKFRNTPKI